MTEADLEVLSRFETVWARVMTGKRSERASQTTQWESLLQGVYAQWRGCRALGRRASGAEQRRMLALAREAGSLYHRLETEYFLKTGDIFITSDGPDFASYTPYNLRKLWNHATKLAESLQNASEEDKQLFSEAAALMNAQGDALKGLIRDCLR